MINELKYFFFILTISLFIFFNLKYYFSDSNKKITYRSLKKIDEKILNFSQNLILLENNTNDIVIYTEKTQDNNQKNYNFWKLITNNE
tara:strand:+ start:123 stop:386 length:264 start_codon:yes stop_codon:yes gene_type:complete